MESLLAFCFMSFYLTYPYPPPFLSLATTCAIQPLVPYSDGLACIIAFVLELYTQCLTLIICLDGLIFKGMEYMTG